MERYYDSQNFDKEKQKLEALRYFFSRVITKATIITTGSIGIKINK